MQTAGLTYFDKNLNSNQNAVIVINFFFSLKLIFRNYYRVYCHLGQRLLALYISEFTELSLQPISIVKKQGKISSCSSRLLLSRWLLGKQKSPWEIEV